MQLSFFHTLYDKGEIRGTAPVFDAYKPNVQFQPFQATGVNVIDIWGLENPQNYKYTGVATPTEAEQRAEGQFISALALRTLNESFISGGKDPVEATAWRGAFSALGPLVKMEVPGNEITVENLQRIDREIKALTDSVDAPNTLADNHPIKTQLATLARQKAYILRAMEGEQPGEFKYADYMRSSGPVAGFFGDLMDTMQAAWKRKGLLAFAPINFVPSFKGTGNIPQSTTEKIIGEDMYDALTEVDPEFNPYEFFETTLASNPIIRMSLLQEGITADTIAYAPNEFAARTQIGMRLQTNKYQQRMALYNPTRWQSVKSFGLSLANVVGNNPDTLPFTAVELAAGALMAIPGGQGAGVGALAALSMGGGGAALKVYRTGKALRTLRNIASTAWSLGAGGTPAWGRSWGLVRAALWNGAVAAGANTTLNYISQSYNISAANGLHYMNPDMAATISNEELLDSALYGFMFGAGLSVGFNALSTGLGKLGGSKNTPLDVSYRNFQRIFGKNTIRAGGPSPISRTIVRAETEGRSPTIEEAHGAVVARATSVDTAADVAARSADSTPDNPLMKRLEGEEIGNYVQRMADSQAMTNAGMVLDAMSGGRRFKDLTPEEQHQVALESLDPINRITEAELASKDITKERKAELEAIRKEADKVVRDTGKQLSKATKEKIAANVKEGKAYTRMGIQTPDALDNASTAKAKAKENAEEIFDRASGKDPVKNKDTSPAGTEAERVATETADETAAELGLTPDRVKDDPAHRRTMVANITKKLLGGDPTVTMKRLAIARSKARKLSKAQRTRQIRVLNNRAAFLTEAVGNREVIQRFYDRIQDLVNRNFLSDEAATLVMAMTVNLNFDRKPAQTKITIGEDIGYSITNDEIRLGNMVLETPDSEIRQAIIVIHEIGHAYEMYATGPSLMKFRKLFQDPKALETAAKGLLESSPFNINYTIGNTQELFAVTFARMLLDELSYTVMLNAAGKNRGLLAHLLQEMVADIGASLIHVADSLKESNAINYVNLYGIVQEVMQQLEEGGKPTLRRIDAINKITNGIQRIKQSYEEYVKKTPATKRLSFVQWLSKKERTSELAKKINRALVGDEVELRDQILMDYGVTPQEAAMLVRMALDNSSMIDTFVNTRAEGLRLTSDSTPTQVRAFAESMAMNQQITRRYFLNIFENYVMALQLNGMAAPKAGMTEGNRGPITNQLEELDAFVNSQPLSALEIQQPYLDPTLGILSNDVNLAVHYLAAQEGIDVTTKDLLGTTRERPTVPTTREEAANKLGSIAKEVQDNPKMSKEDVVTRVKETMNTGPGLTKLLEGQTNPSDVLSTVARGLQDGSIEVDANGMRVALTTLETELTPSELRIVDEATAPLPKVGISKADTTVANTSVTTVNKVIAKELAEGTTTSKKIGRKLESASKALAIAIKTNNLARIAASLWDMQELVRSINKADLVNPETLDAANNTVASGMELLNRNGVEIVEPTGQSWTNKSEVRITKWKPIEKDVNSPGIVSVVKPVIKQNGKVISFGEVVVQDVVRRNPITRKMTNLSTHLDMAITSGDQATLSQALEDAPMSNALLQAAVRDNVAVADTQARTAAIVATGGERLRSIPDQPRTKPEVEVRQAVKDQAKKNQEAADIADAELTTADPSKNRSVAPSEPKGAIGETTAVVTDDVTPVTPHVPVGVAESVASNGNTTTKFTATAATKPMQTLNVSNANFSNPRFGIVNDVYYASLADIEGMLAGIPEDRLLINGDNLRRRIRHLYAKGQEQQAITLFTNTMDMLEIEGVIVRDPKNPSVIVRKFMFNKNKWSYGGIAMTERTKPSAKAEKAKAPDGTDVPVSKVEKDAPDPVETPAPEPKVSPADKLAIILEESRESLRDSGMDVPDFGLLLKKFWRTMKDSAKKKSQYITDEFRKLAYTLSDINATIMEMNRTQLRDSHIAKKFYAEVDRLVAIEQANLQGIANYQMRKMKDIYAEAAAKVSTSTVRFIPPLHPSQIEFRKVKIKGSSFIRIVYNVDKETLKLIRTIQEDTSRLAPKPSPTTVTTPRTAESALPNTENSAKAGGTTEKPLSDPAKPTKEKEITEKTLVKNIIAFLTENKAHNLRASSLLHFMFGGSERSNRNWWRTAMSKIKDFTQLWSSQGLTQRSVIATVRTLSHLFDPSHSKLSDLLLPDQARTLISFAQAYQEANSSILGIMDAYNILRRAANNMKLNADQQTLLLKTYALSFMEGTDFSKDSLKTILGVEPTDELLAALNKLKTQETRLNQLMLDLKEETGWNPIKDKDGNPVTGDKYFTITFDVDKFRRLEESGESDALVEALVKARTKTKLQSDRLDTNTLIVMGILNIDNPDNIFYGERNFTVTTNPNLSKETLDKLRDPDRGYRIHNKSHLSDDIQRDIKKAREEGARKFFVRETDTHIEIIPMPETVADLADVDLAKYRKAVEGDTSVYAEGWRKFLGGKTLVQREIKELMNYKLFRGEYALRNTSRFKRGLRPVLNSKDDNFLRVANISQQELIDDPFLLDFIDLRRDQVAHNLMRFNLFDLYAQRSIDKMAQHKGLRPWRALELIEEEIQKDIQSSSELTQAQKNELRDQVTAGMTRLMYQYSDWNGTLPQIRSPGDILPRAARALVAWSGVGWGISNLAEPVGEMMRKLPSKMGVGIPVDIIRGFARLMKVWDRSRPAEKAGLKDLVYGLEDVQNNFAKLEDSAQRGELNATDTSYGSVYRQTRRDMASQPKLRNKAVSVMEGIGRASVLLGGAREVTHLARSMGRSRLQKQVYDIIKKTNIDRFIELLKDPKNRQLQDDLLKAADTSERSERQLWSQYKALARQAGINPRDALFLSKLGLTDADNLSAIRWVMNELNVQDGQLDFLDLRDMFYKLKGMENPPVDPAVLDRARSAFEFGLVTTINQRSAPFMTGLNKALGPFMLTEWGKLTNSLTSWLRGWEDAFGANLVNMGSAKAITSILVVGAVTNALAAILREWINGRDIEDILEEIEDNPIAYTAYVAAEMPYAGPLTPVVSASVRKAVALSGGGSYGYTQGISGALQNSMTGGPALNAVGGIMRNTGKGIELFSESITENDTAKMVAGALQVSQVSNLVNKGPTGFSIRAAEEFGIWNKVGGLQTVLDHLQRDPKPYAKKKRGAMAEYLKSTGYIPPKRNVPLERATWEARQAERPVITPIQPTPKVETSQGVSSILGALLEGYRGSTP